MDDNKEIKKSVPIRVILNGEVAEIYTKIKEEYGLERDADTIRMIIKRFHKFDQNAKV